MSKKLFVIFGLIFLSGCAAEVVEIPEENQNSEQRQDNLSYDPKDNGAGCFVEATLHEKKYGIEVAKTYYFHCANKQKKNPVSDPPWEGSTKDQIVNNTKEIYK